MNIAEIIAGQLDHTKPDHLQPGVDVGMAEIKDGVKVLFPPSYAGCKRIITVLYDEGSDLYSVKDDNSENNYNGDVVTGVFCDDLGRLVWGDDAKEWNQPFGQLIDAETGKVISEW